MNAEFYYKSSFLPNFIVLFTLKPSKDTADLKNFKTFQHSWTANIFHRKNILNALLIISGLKMTKNHQNQGRIKMFSIFGDFRKLCPRIVIIFDTWKSMILFKMNEKSRIFFYKLVKSKTFCLNSGANDVSWVVKFDWNAEKSPIFRENLQNVFEFRGKFQKLKSKIRCRGQYNILAQKF